MTTLAPFSRRWVGGDIRGLEALIRQCDSVATRITDASHVLSRQVSSIAGAGGWTGRASDAFTSAWDKDWKAGLQLAEAWTRIGSIAGQLAGVLSSLENVLEEKAGRLEDQGIQVDPASGIPLPDTVTSGGACPSPQTLDARTRAASQYMTDRASILAQAEQARTHATNALYTATQELLPNQFDWGQLSNDLDGIRSLWAVPTDVRRDYEKAMDAKGKIDAKAWDELLAKHKVSGYNARLEDTTIDDLAEARASAEAAASRLADAPPESILTRLFSGDPEALSALGAAGKTIRFVPYAGAAAGTAIQIVQDREDHESWTHSIVDGVASNSASLLAGIGTGAVVTGIVGGLVGGGGSIVAVGAGTVAGTFAAIGVGDAVHNLVQEHWSADIRQHGVLDGLGHGTVDSLDKTRHDLAHYGDDIIHIF